MIRRDYTESDIIVFRNKLVMMATDVIDSRVTSYDELKMLVTKHDNKCYELILNAVMSAKPTLGFNEFKFRSLTAVIKVLTEKMNGKECCNTHLAVSSRKDMVNHILQSIR